MKFILKLFGIIEFAWGIKCFPECVRKLIWLEMVFAVDDDSELLDLLNFVNELILIFLGKVNLIKNDLDEETFN